VRTPAPCSNPAGCSITSLAELHCEAHCSQGKDQGADPGLLTAPAAAATKLNCAADGAVAAPGPSRPCVWHLFSNNPSKRRIVRWLTTS